MQRIKLWSFQTAAVDHAMRLLRGKHDRVLIVSPGGSGKTVMLAEIARRFVAQGKKVLVLAHRRELVEQAHEHFTRHGLPADKISVILPDSASANDDAQLRVGTINTLWSRDLYHDADVVLVDEAHRIAASMYSTALAHYPRAKVVGFTATPFRMDQRGLGDVFSEMVVAAQPSTLMEQGRVVRPLYYRDPEDATPDLSKIGRAHGDYNQTQLAERVMRSHLIGGVVSHWERLARDRTTIGFAVSKAHARMLTDAFLERGHAAACLLDGASMTERSEMLKQVVDGRITVLFSCMILTEGYDLPECEAVILARPTLSLALFLQQAYRGLRAHEGKRRPILLDHGRNYGRFGLPEADRHFSLSAGTKSLHGHGALVRDCPSCMLVSPISERICPGCGHVFVDPLPMPLETDDLLELVTRKALEKTERHIRDGLAQRGIAEDKIEHFVRCFVAARADAAR